MMADVRCDALMGRFKNVDHQENERRTAAMAFCGHPSFICNIYTALSNFICSVETAVSTFFSRDSKLMSTSVLRTKVVCISPSEPELVHCVKSLLGCVFVLRRRFFKGL
jgi:hypothetical protein